MKNWRYDWNQYSNLHALHAYITKGLKAIYIVLHWEENLIYFIILIWLVRGPLHFTLQACVQLLIFIDIYFYLIYTLWSILTHQCRSVVKTSPYTCFTGVLKLRNKFLTPEISRYCIAIVIFCVSFYGWYEPVWKFQVRVYDKS